MRCAPMRRVPALVFARAMRFGHSERGTTPRATESVTRHAHRCPISLPGVINDGGRRRPSSVTAGVIVRVPGVVRAPGGPPSRPEALVRQQCTRESTSRTSRVGLLTSSSSGAALRLAETCDRVALIRRCRSTRRGARRWCRRVVGRAGTTVSPTSRWFPAECRAHRACRRARHSPGYRTMQSIRPDVAQVTSRPRMVTDPRGARCPRFDPSAPSATIPRPSAIWPPW